jgi:primosomal protein N' (replication factor Y)
LPLVVRVVPDVAGIDKTFDYLVPEPMRGEVRVGTMVRVALHGRRVGAWVVAVDVEPPPGVALKPIAKVTGWGPSGEVIDLARWAAWRWAGRLIHLLGTASPPGAVRALPPPRAERASSDGRAATVTVVRSPPGADVLGLVREAATRGDALIVGPSVDAIRVIGRQLRSEGLPVALAPRDWARCAAGGVSVLGARAAAWAPVPRLSEVIVLDEHDERLKEERAPTWHVREVLVERARRAGVPCTLVSPCPSLESLAVADQVVEPSRVDERAGWPVLDVVDRRAEDVRSGLYSHRFVELLRDRERGKVVCVLNRTGRSRLLACAACGEVARCQRCDAAVQQPERGMLSCARCGTERPALCLACGATHLRNLRVGVSRAREELEALAREPVGELTATTATGLDARVVIGTEAVLHQVEGSAGVVAFLDIDQELLAPRYRAAEQAMGLLALGARLLGPRARGGRLLVQTRDPQHPVLAAVLHADPAGFAEAERANRAALEFPPFTALAAVSGAAAPAFVEGIDRSAVEVLGPADDRWLIRAPDHTILCDTLAATPRLPGRLRVEVDPLRI